MKKHYFFLIPFFLIFQSHAITFFKPFDKIIEEKTTWLVTPTFNSFPPICAGTTPPVLPTTSLNGIVGTWSPAIVSNTTTTTYTFTPNPGQDATTATLTIIVATPAIPVLSVLEPTCTIALGEITIVASPGQTYSFDSGPFSATLVYSGLAPNSTHCVRAKSGVCISESVCVTIFPQPVTPLAPDVTLIYPDCSTATLTITGVPGETYSFDLAAYSSTLVYSGLAVGSTHNITAQGLAGCISAVTTVTIAPLPTATIAPPVMPDQTVCLHTPMIPIIYGVGDGATGATITGLPTGITYSYSAGTLTISGTPTVVGVFNYIITTTGGCGVASAGGIITVVPNSSLTLTSQPFTTMQTVCDGTPITPIEYSATGATTVTASGLPAGVTGNYAAGVFTISGTPTVGGTFNIIIDTSGGCGSASLAATIIVSPNVAITLASAAPTANQTVCINTPILPVSYAVTNGATGGNITSGSLPTGVTANFSAGIFTITGMPSETGIFNYVVSTSGGCSTASLAGSIVVNPSGIVILACDPSQVTVANSVFFDWAPVPGASAYNYSYSINGGPAVTGNTALTNLEVFGVAPGQSVTLTITSASGAVCVDSTSITCGLPLAVSDFENENFKYFPNPVNDILNLSYIQPILNVQISNLIGQQVYNTSFDSKSIQVDMSGFNSGVYMVKITTTDAVKTFKVIKE